MLSIIEHKLGPPSESVRQRVEEADPQTLMEWSRRIVDSESLDAVLH